jgi:hypothetical protein
VINRMGAVVVSTSPVSVLVTLNEGFPLIFNWYGFSQRLHIRRCSFLGARKLRDNNFKPRLASQQLNGS